LWLGLIAATFIGIETLITMHYICPMALQIQLTKDQSHTLYVPELDETYHSRNGAVEEALYVYVLNGMRHYVNTYLPKHIAILEVGFGTGLNAWLTALACHQLNIPCHYYTLETHPLELDTIRQLNYTQQANKNDALIFEQLHTAAWNEIVPITPLFALHKYNIALQQFDNNTPIDIIYFDAFAPEKQPEMWTLENFTKLYTMLAQNGCMVTYSSKGDIKRMWREIGFAVERLPGPPMKRHMLRATKK
jgi:tRNA U34 5-methylaminomethyl-2-thiouridine-forming methyltransferase MnmC